MVVVLGGEGLPEPERHREVAGRLPAMPPDMARSSVFHRCQWVSTRPGATIIPRASSSRAPGAPSAAASAGADRGDAPAGDQDVAAGDVPQPRVHGHHVPGPDDEVLAHRFCGVRGHRGASQHAAMVLRTGAHMVGMAHG